MQVQAKSFIPVVELFVRGADVDQKTLMVVIGGDGKVVDYGLTQTSMD